MSGREEKLVSALAARDAGRADGEPPEELDALRDELETWPEELDGLRDELETWMGRLRDAGPAPVGRGDDLAGGPLSADAIPGYLLLAEIGRGGQGVVYRALQTGTRRLVALKLLRDGPLASMSSRRRFEREVELAATLAHPSIVAIHEAGATETNRPFIAMELAEGERLDRHLGRTDPSFVERIRLVLRIVAAIRHAHQKGVIHLDIKPSNVMVEADGGVKVLDFGLARSLEEDAPHATLTLAVAMGTPAYMAPEQVRGARDQWDSRTDVYGLGVLLFEVVTGRLPYDLEKLRGGALEVMKTVETRSPHVPSDVLDSARRPSKRELRDLDAIVRRSLAKRQDERYGSVVELEADLAALLAGGTVAARQHERGYRIRCALREHRLFFLSLAAVVVGLAALAAYFRWTSKREAHLRDLADQRFEQVRDIANAFIHDVDPLISKLPGAAPARDLIVRQGLEYLDALASEADGDPELEIELAQAYRAIGDVQIDTYSANLGRPAEAVASYEAALLHFDRAAAAPDADRRVIDRERLNTHLALVVAHGSGGHATEAESAAERALEIAEALVPESDAERLDLAECLDVLSITRRDQGRLAEARALAERAQGIYVELLAADEPGTRRSLAVGHTRLAEILIGEGDLEGALAEYRLFLDVVLEAEEPSDWVDTLDLAAAHEWIGRIEADLGRTESAIGSLRRAAELHRSLVAGDPTRPKYRMSFVSVLNRVGEAELARGELDAAQAAFEDFLAEAARLQEDLPEIARSHRMLAVAHSKFGELHQARAKDLEDDAQKSELRLAKEAIERARAIFVDMDERGILSPSDAGVEDALTEEIRALDDELEG